MSYIVIINLVMIIKKRSGGKDVMLLGDFALEPLKWLCLLHRIQTGVAQSFVVWFQKNHTSF